MRAMASTTFTGGAPWTLGIAGRSRGARRAGGPPSTIPQARRRRRRGRRCAFVQIDGTGDAAGGRDGPGRSFYIRRAGGPGGARVDHAIEDAHGAPGHVAPGPRIDADVAWRMRAPGATRRPPTPSSASTSAS